MTTQLPLALIDALKTVSDSEGVPAYQMQSESSPENAVRMVPLEDVDGKLQVICRQVDLLDVTLLNKQLGRDFRAINRRELRRLTSRLEVQTLPALPSLTGWPSLVDPAVDGLNRINLSFQSQGPVIDMTAAAYRELTGDIRRFTTTTPQSSIDVNLSEPELDREQVHDAIKRLTNLRIRQRLEDTLELPPLPETAQRIIHLRVNPNAVMNDLVDVVESDPSLAAQVVSWASSSFYAAAGQVRSVHDAVSRVLGFEMVMNLAMGLSLGRALKAPEDEPDGYIGYWQQAIWQAQSAGILSAMMRRGERPSFGLAYLSGLLHNFGYLVLNQVFPPHFRLVCRNLEANSELDSSLVEHHLLGVTREQLGAQLMENWGMPDEVVTAIRQQKNPDYSGTNAVYARLLWLGRQLLIERGVELGSAVPVPDDMYQSLGLDPAAVAEQFDDMMENRDSILAMAGMMQS
ncbi:HDOD domain-containing protein [Marinobacter sp. BGYM27]|uniref:HDOD domain-containing protein n=1 Tax=unclassified Marinobacter TaxID=83889 RepID=UPI0021A74EEC|nr:HDOD domain-containing protein [Marinobacter sp. BGYM27]MDG5499803.1 HDOD domain-containing protein [Marinobacter sp. BGYM27]